MSLFKIEFTHDVGFSSQESRSLCEGASSFYSVADPLMVWEQIQETGKTHKDAIRQNPDNQLLQILHTSSSIEDAVLLHVLLISPLLIIR